jgi:hypothetical protein
VLVLLLWPSVAWLRSRRRMREAAALAVAVAAAAALGPELLPLVALASGALVYALTALNLPLGVRVTSLAMLGLLALAPILPFIVRPLAAGVLPGGHPFRANLEAWQRLVVNEPMRLITGHGFETALRGRFAGLLPPTAPNTLLFEIWYDLGVIGALAGAAARTRRSCPPSWPPSRPPSPSPALASAPRRCGGSPPSWRSS